MKIGIVGAGFTGLTAGYELAKAGHEVVIFEKEKRVGGLAGDFKPSGWKWGLEKYYHHIFSGDKEVINLAEEIGWPAFFKKPLSSSLLMNDKKRLDSPLSLLKFNAISLPSRIQMGIGLASLKVIKNGIRLERYRVIDVLPKLVGLEGYRTVWEPLLVAKFGKYLNKVNMAWFWARINKRTSSLGSFEGGFGKLAEKIAEEITRMNGEIRLGTKYRTSKVFDKILNTTPDKKLGLSYLWGQTLVLELNKSLMNEYWLNVLERNWPFLVAVEQSNFIDKKNYDNKHVVYLGNYLENGDKRLKMSDKDLLELYLPYLKKINPNFKKNWIKRKWKFQNNYAQPVFPVNYSQIIPRIKTEKENLYVANMAMVYPWDRGVNFAVELGQRAARVIMSSDPR